MKRTFAAIGVSMLASVAAAQSAAPFTIGIITDMSGTYSAITGKGSIEAAKMAIDDFGGKVLNRPVDIITADHQNKSDIAGAVARKWLEEGTVQALAEGTNSATTAAALAAAKAKNRVMLVTSAGSPIFTNEQCSDSGVHFGYDTNAVARTIVGPLVKQGKDTWYFVTADYAGGHALQSSIVPLVEKMKGKVVGSVLHPFQATDFSSYLLQAQASKAKVIVAANAGKDTINTMKQAAEFQVGQDGKQAMATSLLFLSDIKAMGLPIAQKLYAATPFYWDMNEATRTFARRFQQRTGFAPEMTHAASYSGVLHYLKAVQASGSVDARAVTQKMKELPVNDFWNSNVRVRADGRVLHNFYLVQVKTPAESKSQFDLLKVLSEVPGGDAFPSIAEGKCVAAKDGK
ncbi:ABC transporter substrate-binding protein [Cupriavidus necator]|uniref:ABC transporter substrate-binding protein n=1 Tax=Cupriavidus necator TaxID=106590 RepID=UPI0039C32B52